MREIRDSLVKKLTEAGQLGAISYQTIVSQKRMNDANRESYLIQYICQNQKQNVLNAKLSLNYQKNLFEIGLFQENQYSIKMDGKVFYQITFEDMHKIEKVVEKINTMLKNLSYTKLR